MVGNRTEQISTDTIKTLINAGYIDYDASKPNASPKITANGFQFLLMSTNAQVWYFILHYLDTIEAKGFNFVECLSFLFQLSFSTVGRDYLMDGLSENILGFLQNLREFGFIYQRKRKDGRFYPTRLVVNLASSCKDEVATNSEEGYLIVETNYRVYAYTGMCLHESFSGPLLEVILISNRSLSCSTKRFATSNRTTLVIRRSEIPIS